MHHRHALDVRFQDTPSSFKAQSCAICCTAMARCLQVMSRTKGGLPFCGDRKRKCSWCKSHGDLAEEFQLSTMCGKRQWSNQACTTHTLTDILPVSDYIWLILIDNTSTLWWPKLRLQLCCQKKNEDSNSNHEKWSIAKNITKLAKRFLDQLGTWTGEPADLTKQGQAGQTRQNAPYRMPIYAYLWLQPVLSISDYLRLSQVRDQSWQYPRSHRVAVHHLSGPDLDRVSNTAAGGPHFGWEFVEFVPLISWDLNICQFI